MQARSSSLRLPGNGPERSSVSILPGRYHQGGQGLARRSLVVIEINRRAATTAMLSLAGCGAPPLKRGQPIEPATTGYAQGWLIEGATRILFISGQTPTDAEGTAPG